LAMSAQPVYLDNNASITSGSGRVVALLSR
jgi:hypothetical protein